MAHQDTSGNSLLLIDDSNSTHADRSREKGRGRGGGGGKQGREFVHGAGVISRLVCTRVFEPRVLFPLTDERSVARGFPSSPSPPFLLAQAGCTSSHHPAPSGSPRNPRWLAAVSLLPPVFPSPRHAARRSPGPLCRLLKTRLAADFPTKE